jgi:hypothetical protein
MKEVHINSSGRSWLQSRIATIAKAASSKNVQISAQAHSENVASLIISVSGVEGIMQNSVIMVQSKDENYGTNFNPDDPMTYNWYGFANGYKYQFSGVDELQGLIRKQIQIMKSRIRT